MDNVLDEIRSPARRLSDENWKLFESWKRERNDLKTFQDKYVRPHAEANEEDLGEMLYGLSDCESSTSCGHTACHHLTFCEDGSVSKYESCLDTARSSLPAIQQQEEENDEDHTFDFSTEVMMNQSWSKEIKMKFEKKNNNFYLPSLRRESYGKLETMRNETREEFIDAQTDLDQQDKFVDKQNSKLTAAVRCLLAMEPFQKYFRGIIYHEAEEDEFENKQKTTTLEYVLKVFKKTRRLREDECLSEIQNLAAEFLIENDNNVTCFEKLKATLGKLHEEIILAKNNGSMKRTCLRKCRQSNRSNHSIVSHVFRGHLKKRAQCPCGHQNISHDPFTSIQLFSSKLDEKIIVIPVNTRNEAGQFSATRFLLRFNQYTTIDDIKIKLANVGEYDSSNLVIASVKLNDIKSIHEPASTIFDAICEDGELQAFVVCNKQKKGIEGQSEIREDNFPFTSTPALTDISDNEGDEKVDPLRVENKKKMQPAVVAIVFKDDTFERKDEGTYPPAFIQVQKAVQVASIAKIVNYLLGDAATESKKPFATVVKIKDGSCVVCGDQNCTGCHVTPNRSLPLDSTCKIVVFIPPGMKMQQQKIFDDDSFATGIAAHVYTLTEGIAAFRNEESKMICNACGLDQFFETTRTVISYPDILVLTINSEFAANKNIVLPYAEFSPVLSKSNKSKKRYDLFGLIESTNESIPHRKTVYLPATCHRQGKKRSNKNIEILIYTNNQHGERRRVKKAAKAMVIRKKRKMPTNYSEIEKVHPLLRQKLQNNNIEEKCKNEEMKDDDTVSTCNCSRCYCWEKCAEQIRGSSNATVEKLKQEEEFQVLKENLTPTPSMAIQLQRAIFKQDLRRVVSLLKKGANPNDFVDGSGAIHFAAGLTNPAGYLFTKLLIDHGANVTLKSAGGQTPIQFAAMFGRSETVRLLSYHGADLNEAEKVDCMRDPKSNTTLSRGSTEVFRTPQDSPVSKRYFEENCNDDDPYLRTMIQLKKSLALDHEILGGPKCREDNMEGLRRRSVKVVADRLYPKFKQHDEAADDSKEQTLETRSLIPLEITEDIRVSDLTDGNYERDPDFLGEDQEVRDQVTDNPRMSESDQCPLSQVDKAADDNMNPVPSTVNFGFVDSTVESIAEDARSIEYVPKSFIRPTKSKWTKYMCCRSAEYSFKKGRKTSRPSAVREYVRMMLRRFTQRFHVSAN